MAQAAKPETLRVRIPFVGFIPCLNIYGPTTSFITKEACIELIRLGYEIQIQNRKIYPELVALLDQYHASIKAQEFIKAQQIADTIKFRNNPNADIIKNANRDIEKLRKSGQLAAGNTPDTNTVVARALQAADNAQNIALQNAGNQERKQDYQNQLNNLEDLTTANQLVSPIYTPPATPIPAISEDTFFQKPEAFMEDIPIPSQDDEDYEEEIIVKREN